MFTISGHLSVISPDPRESRIILLMRIMSDFELSFTLRKNEKGRCVRKEG